MTRKEERTCFSIADAFLSPDSAFLPFQSFFVRYCVSFNARNLLLEIVRTCFSIIDTFLSWLCFSSFQSTVIHYVLLVLFNSRSLWFGNYNDQGREREKKMVCFFITNVFLFILTLPFLLGPYSHVSPCYLDVVRTPLMDVSYGFQGEFKILVITRQEPMQLHHSQDRSWERDYLALWSLKLVLLKA